MTRATKATANAVIVLTLQVLLVWLFVAWWTP